MHKGGIKWFNEQKGFEFISQHSGDDLFVDFSSINQDGSKVFQKGDKVEFEIAWGKMGLQACEERQLCSSREICFPFCDSIILFLIRGFCKAVWLFPQLLSSQMLPSRIPKTSFFFRS